MPAVPRIIAPKNWTPASAHRHVCLVCDHPVLAASLVALQSGMDAHARYVNAHADRAVDPHFDEQRVDALLGP